MENVDVFVWIDGEDGAGASLAVRALKSKMNCEVGQWFLLGSKTERLERLGYDLGMHTLVRPGDLTSLGALAASNGSSSVVLFWSAKAVLVSDWTPWQNDQVKLWENCPAAFWRRSDLPGGAPANIFDVVSVAKSAWPAVVPSWEALQSQSPLTHGALPSGQVKVVPAEEFEKASHGNSWPFGPSVVIMEKPAPRR